MFKKILCTKVQHMPTTEELALYGIRELSFEELLQINGGRMRSKSRCSSSPSGSSSSSSSAGSSCSSYSAQRRQKRSYSSGSFVSSGNKYNSTSGQPKKVSWFAGAVSKNKNKSVVSTNTVSGCTVQKSDVLSSIAHRRYPSAKAQELRQKIKEAEQEKNGSTYAMTKKNSGSISGKKRNFVTKVRDFFDDVIDSVNIAATERQKGTIQAVDKIYEKSAGAAKHLWKQAAKWHYEDRDTKNKNLPSYEELKKMKSEGNTDWIRMPKSLAKYHQNGIGSPEMKFTNKDGREAVYTKDFSSDGSYELYTDPRYKGTYNYVTPSPLPGVPDSITDFEGIGNFITDGSKFLATGTGHFFCDMLPYYALGNER